MIIFEVLNFYLSYELNECFTVRCLVKVDILKHIPTNIFPLIEKHVVTLVFKSFVFIKYRQLAKKLTMTPTRL